jgi:hypothetical protein
MNELTGAITVSSEKQTTVADKSLVNSLEGTVVWDYDSMTCLQMVVQLYKHRGMGLRFDDLPPDGGTAVQGFHESLHKSDKYTRRKHSW